MHAKCDLGEEEDNDDDGQGDGDGDSGDGQQMPWESKARGGPKLGPPLPGVDQV